MKSTVQCNVIDMDTTQRQLSADTVVRLRAPIAVKIRGKVLPVVKVAQQKFKTLIA